MPDDFNAKVIAEFRASGGEVAAFEGAPLLLLTTTGARSGRAHTTPLVYLREGGRLFVFGSKAGAPSHPAWYYNLVANPVVTVELGSERFEAEAAVASGDERARVFARQAEARPQFREFQTMTSREIPVIELLRR
ncbi:MAG TPA: nitroreductase family deazaflavin-dependent oxidoreductase [Gaiellaceae bacterium]|nr:nitroreductase family deazaflavin-dependent oxidoreductase [Gaiellaceae bacterium]